MSVDLQLALASLGVLALGTVLTYLVKFLKTKTQNAALGSLLVRFAEAVSVAVKATAQTYVDALKAAAADGQLTDDERAQALAKAIEKAKSYISIDEIAKLFSITPAAAEGLLTDRIEAAVRDIDQGK